MMCDVCVVCVCMVCEYVVSREKIYTRSRADPRETKHLCEKWSERLAGNEDAVYIARNRGDLRAIDLAQLQPGCSWI